MYSGNPWGGSFEVAAEDERSRAAPRELDETQRSWLLEPQRREKKDKYVDLGCVVCKRKVIRWALWALVIAFFVIALPIIIVKSLPKGKPYVAPPDQYAVALHKALLFFDAQKSGRLPKNHKVSWRGNSGLKDGSTLTDVEGGLVGGYYDAGDNIKFHFPMAFSMTLLSWSAIEYSQKFKNLGEYDHVRDLIKWGTDYLLLTFNSSATNIDKIYSQVGIAKNASTTPDDHFCWMRPEDMDYERPVLQTTSGPDLAGEMAAALAAASIVFRDDEAYSAKLVKAGAALFRFARSNGRRNRYSAANPEVAMFYNSTGYYDEYMWAGAWMFYASGNTSYLSLATNPGIPRNAKAFLPIRDLNVFSWDNKLPGAELLLTRLRILISPGFPYEDMLNSYHNANNLNLCSFFPQFNSFNFTPGGMIQLNHGRPQNLQYIVKASFLASLYADYLDLVGAPGFNCGPNYFSLGNLRSFAASQVDYVLGKNPRNMSYVVGYGPKYPRHVHHRGASIPTTARDYGCTGGSKWRDTRSPDPNIITGAMVGGPDKADGYEDSRPNYHYTEPTMVGNAGLVAALVSLTATAGSGIDKNTIFSSIPTFYKTNPPPPPPWKP
ncbi:endoglucanase 12-like [Wolffia australiana]